MRQIRFDRWIKGKRGIATPVKAFGDSPLYNPAFGTNVFSHLPYPPYHLRISRPVCRGPKISEREGNRLDAWRRDEENKKLPRRG